MFHYCSVFKYNRLSLLNSLEQVFFPCLDRCWYRHICYRNNPYLYFYSTQRDTCEWRNGDLHKMILFRGEILCCRCSFNVWQIGIIQETGGHEPDNSSQTPLALLIRVGTPAVQMQFRLFSLALIVLNCMEYSNCQTQSNRWRRNKRGKWKIVYICIHHPCQCDSWEREVLDSFWDSNVRKIKIDMVGQIILNILRPRV